MKLGRLLTTTLFLSQSVSAQTLTLYSSRSEHLIKPVLNLYTQETGVQVNFLTGKSAGLIKRLTTEGKGTAADVFLTVDAGNLWFADQHKLFQKVDSPILEKNIPGHLRSPKQTWFGFSLRARTIVYSKDRVKKSTLSRYEDLADPRWRGDSAYGPPKGL